MPLSIADVGTYWYASGYLNERIPEGWREIILIWLGVAIKCIAYVSIVHAALSYARGQPTAARHVLRIPWRRVPVTVALGLILQTFSFWPMPLLDWSDDSDRGLAVNYVVLTINVLAFDVISFVSVPVLLAENLSLLGTVRRSIQLARGHVWRILAIDIGSWLLYFALNEGVSQVYFLIDPEWGMFAWSCLTALTIVVMMSLGCCVVAATYHLIRGEHEGPPPESLVRVFD